MEPDSVPLSVESLIQELKFSSNPMLPFNEGFKVVSVKVNVISFLIDLFNYF